MVRLEEEEEDEEEEEERREAEGGRRGLAGLGMLLLLLLLLLLLGPVLGLLLAPAAEGEEEWELQSSRFRFWPRLDWLAVDGGGGGKGQMCE